MSDKIKNQIRKILFEDTWNQYGSEYMSHPQDQETTVPPNLPVVPDDLMPNQLAVERPPVEDENFVPDGVGELSRSVAVLAKQVPAEEVAAFYKGVHSLLDSAIANHNEPETLSATAEEEEAEKDVLEDELVVTQEIKNLMKKILKEQPKEWQMTDWSQIKLGKQDEEEEEEDLEPAAIRKQTIKGKNIAPYYNKASPSGVQNASDRLLHGYFKAMMDVRGDEVADSTQYLRDQFSLLTTDMEDIPPESPQAFLGVIMKKAVKRGTTDGEFDGRLLFHVVTYWKSLNAKAKAKLVDDAIEETHSEMADWDTLVQTLQTEDPEQYEVLMSLDLR